MVAELFQKIVVMRGLPLPLPESVFYRQQVATTMAAERMNNCLRIFNSIIVEALLIPARSKILASTSKMKRNASTMAPASVVPFTSW